MECGHRRLRIVSQCGFGARADRAIASATSYVFTIETRAAVAQILNRVGAHQRADEAGNSQQHLPQRSQEPTKAPSLSRQRFYRSRLFMGKVARCVGRPWRNGCRSSHYRCAHRTSATGIAAAAATTRRFATGGAFITPAKATAKAAARVSETAAAKRYARQSREGRQNQ